MERREFARSLGAGILSGWAATSVLPAGQMALPEPDTGTGKPVRIGIVGAENSHTVRFGKMFNVERRFPGVEVVAVWGETDEFAQKASQAGSISRIVKEPRDLLGMVDAVIIDHRHARYHGAAAVPFLEAGIPTFVDKPFTYRTQEAQHVLDLAKKHGTPITCLSGVGYGSMVDDMARQVAEIDGILSVIVTGPADIDSKYGGIFFYGVHLVERMFKIFGDDVNAVRATRHGSRVTFQFKFDSGHLATAILADKWDVFCLTKEGLIEIKPRVEDDNGLGAYAAMVRMFQTGTEPRTHESILKTVAVLEAMERSVYNEDWELPIV